MATQPPSPPARGRALGIWFCGLAVLGLVRFYLSLQRAHGEALDPVAWAWLGGSLLLAAIGAATLVRGRRR